MTLSEVDEKEQTDVTLETARLKPDPVLYAGVAHWSLLAFLAVLGPFWERVEICQDPQTKVLMNALSAYNDRNKELLQVSIV